MKSIKSKLMLACSLAVLAFQRAFSAPPTERPQFCNIGEGIFETGCKSYAPDATGSARYLCYKIGATADTVAVCGAGEVAIGSSDDVADSLTTPITIQLFGAVRGLVRVITDGTIVNGDHVKGGAAGVVTKASTTDVSFGIAVIGSDQSSAAGDTITIIPCVAHKYVF